MQSSLDLVGLVFFFVMAALWAVFALIFGLRKKPSKIAEHARDPKSLGGLLLQSIGYALAWIAPRPHFSPIVPMPKWAEIAVAVAALVLAALSLWLMWRAIIVLGKQWAYVARIVEGHTLITEGPYSLVRNPIYTGMLGMLVATGLAASRWYTLIAAILFFLCGTWVRVRREENLLRQSFGAEFEIYRSRVPALIPWLF
ncbi:MAG TPA: isoprenylcysteine carboxylmethyltransferase family protein [Candidatus Acidoferrales bacterium]|nr:isoprenylcysteine carboxylmethyltransferase family protein [Candidatus Acidoferrales bacterium]